MSSVDPHIVLITSGQPSLNPRLVKEVRTLRSNGFHVTVIYQYWNAWGTELDKKIIEDWKIYRVGGDPGREKLIYFISRLIFKFCNLFSKRFGIVSPIAELSLGRCTLQLKQKAKSIKADLYIAHNLAALPAAVAAAKKNKAKCGFDAEDFHRNEVSDDVNNFDVRLKTYIEEKYFPQLTYLTTASPLISKAYQKLFRTLSPVTVLNVFPKQHIQIQDKPKNGLRLFWFSQTIGRGRGLEDIIEVIAGLEEEKIELHLLGQVDDGTQAYFNEMQSRGSKKSFIHFHRPIAAEEIFSFAAQFDIGLATEISTPKNRDICLTNKIFTYIHAGLAVIASDTSAQSQLMSTYDHMGKVYRKQDPESLRSILLAYLRDNDLLLANKKNAKKYADELLNWEIEQQKFLTIVKSILH